MVLLKTSNCVYSYFFNTFLWLNTALQIIKYLKLEIKGFHINIFMFISQTGA